MRLLSWRRLFAAAAAEAEQGATTVVMAACATRPSTGGYWVMGWGECNVIHSFH